MGVLEKIRQRPENEKRVISLVLAGVITLIIVGSWFMVGDTRETAQVETESTLSSISPIQVIKDEFSKAVSNFKETVSTEASTTDTETASTSVQVEVTEQ